MQVFYSWHAELWVLSFWTKVDEAQSGGNVSLQSPWVGGSYLFIVLRILLLKSSYSSLFPLLFCFVSFSSSHLINVRLKLVLCLSFEKILVFLSEEIMHILYVLILYFSCTHTRVIKEGKHMNTNSKKVTTKI